MIENLSSLRRVAGPVVAIACTLAAFAAGAVAAPSVMSSLSDDGTDNYGPVTPQTVVASGDSKSFGHWEIVSSKDKAGGSCIGLRLTDDNNATGPLLAEACGSAEVMDNQVGAFNDERGTMFYGRVVNDAEDAVVEQDGKRAKEAKAVHGSDGRKYVVAAVDGANASQAAVTLSDRNGRALGRVDSRAVAAKK